MATSRSGSNSQGLARRVNQHANNAATATSARDSRRSRPPMRITAAAPIRKVSEAARPKVPVRSHWSAITPMIRTEPRALSVALDRTRALAQAGTGAGAPVTGSHCVPSQRQRPSRDS